MRRHLLLMWCLGLLGWREEQKVVVPGPLLELKNLWKEKGDKKNICGVYKRTHQNRNHLRGNEEEQLTSQETRQVVQQEVRKEKGHD